uniref:C-type lectin domain-containing protein n=1 Tax=Fundulus heteroclitus TaxID=8078 RepID=A0A3Q2Q2N2_FUNHE
MAGRYIIDNIRLVLDLLDYSDLISKNSFSLFLDFQKAFDSREHDACCWCEKYVFVADLKKSWYFARKHCEQHYIDLLQLTSEEEENFFKECWNDQWKEGWIGIYWDRNKNAWTWSGGDLVTYDSDLDLSEKDDHTKNVLWTNGKWEWKNGEDLVGMVVIKSDLI